MPLTEQEARRRVRRLRGFYVQLGWFVVVNLFLLIVNLVTSPDDLWFYWVTIFWGLGLVLHVASIYLHKDFLGKDWEERKVEALTKYVSQFSSGWYDYKGPELSPEEKEEVKKMLRQWIHQNREGKPMEGFRYYKGLPDNIGR